MGTEHSINTDWYMGKSMVKMFQNEETATTKNV